jgi:hypothetical protein
MLLYGGFKSCAVGSVVLWRLGFEKWELWLTLQLWSELFSSLIRWS